MMPATYKVTIFLSIVCLHMNASACTFPSFGPYYDQLIKVTEIEGKNQFKVAIQRRVDDLLVHHVGVFYLIDDAENSDENKEYSDYYQNLYTYSYYKLFLEWITFQSRADLEIVFEAEYIGGHMPIVSVLWRSGDCCMCSADGKSEYLKVKP